MTAGCRMWGLALVAVLATHLPARASEIRPGNSSSNPPIGTLPDLARGGTVELSSPELAYQDFSFDGIGINRHTFKKDVNFRLGYSPSQPLAGGDEQVGDFAIDIVAHLDGYLAKANGPGYGDEWQVGGGFDATITSVSVISPADPAAIPEEIVALINNPDRIRLDSPEFRGPAGSLPPITVTIDAAPVPEPTTLATLALGAAAFGLRAARRRRKAGSAAA